MAYCPNCGNKLNGMPNFCPNCGANLSDVQYTAPETGENIAGAAAQTAGTTGQADHRPIYDVVLVRLENCSKETCMDLLQGLLGYEADLAEKVIEDCPSLIGTSLTRPQAVTIAQAFSEYGADMTIYSPDDSEDFEGKEEEPQQQTGGTAYQGGFQNGYGNSGFSGAAASGQPIYTGNGYTGSVFKEDGSLIGTAAAVIVSLAAVNLISGASKWDRPDGNNNIFRPAFSTKPPGRPPRPGYDPFRAGGRRDPSGRPRPDGHRRPGEPGRRKD